MAGTPRSLTYALELKNAIADLVGPALHSLEANLHGNTCWIPGRLLLTTTLMSWHEGQTLAERFEHVRSILKVMHSDEPIPTSYSGYAQSLCRRIDPIVSAMRPRLQTLVKTLAGARWKVHGWVVFIADGSRFESPRTVGNEQVLKCAGKRGSAPQVFQTTLLHLGTNAIWDFRCGPGTASERRHLEEMLADLPPRSLIAADAGFSGFELYRRLDAAGVKFLLRVGGNVTLRTLSKLANLETRGDEVWIWPDRERSQPPLRLRLLRLSQSGSNIYLVTNILDAAELSATAAGEIYRRRWGIEVTYRSIKQTFNRRMWLSRSAANVLAEHQGTMLGFWLLQLKSLQELRRVRRKVNRWSPAASRRATRRVLRDVGKRPSTAEESWSVQLQWAVKDEYRRTRSRKARDWPHKKREPPPQSPRWKHMTNLQRREGEKLLDSC